MAESTTGRFTSDLKQVKKGDKVLYVDVFVHKALSPDVFVVGDKSDAVLLDISAKPEFGKDVSVGKCFGLPKPP
jgi:hypothetical protein